MTNREPRAKKTVDDVRDFWEMNPLFEGESNFAIGSKEYFEEHRQVVINDCFAGFLEPRIFPDAKNSNMVLDLGCGPGFWVIELRDRGARKVVAADLTNKALVLTRRRIEIFNVKDVEISQQNAECLSFPDETFSHVNCCGVIHHTPSPESCVNEIARVLLPEGTAVIAVYYKNVLLRLWPVIRYLGKLLYIFGGGLKGRGRSSIFETSDIDEIVRLYDGAINPIGKAYSKEEFKQMLEKEFVVTDLYHHFFPARSLPFKIPQWLHRFLDRNFGFMIYANCLKPRN